MATLEIRLFGGVRIGRLGWPSEVRITHAVQALLAYLVLNRHRIHPREVLAELFWGDYPEERARRSLSTALWRLRRALEPHGRDPENYLLTSTAGEIGFNSGSDYWLDVAAFKQKASRIVGKQIADMEMGDARELEHAVQLYVGDLLEGFYDDWALREREHLRSLYLKTLSHLMGFHGCRRNWEWAIAYGEKILELDPLREEVYRDVMRLHAQNGHRTLAIRQYRICRDILKKELGITPMEETQSLFRQIRKAEEVHHVRETFSPRQPPSGADQASKLDQACISLQQASHQFEKGREELQRAFHLLEQVMRGG
jgi:DNA-binding SARP family transcriptional activator